MVKGINKSLHIQRKSGNESTFAMFVLTIGTLLFVVGYGNAVEKDASRVGSNRDEYMLSSEDIDIKKERNIKGPPRKFHDDADLLLTEDDVEKFNDYFVDDHEAFADEFNEDDEVDEDDVIVGDDDEQMDEEEFDEDDLWLFQYDPIEVGYIQNIEAEDGSILKMKTLAVNPPIFEIKNFLSHDECDHVMALVTKNGLHTSLTVPEKTELSEAEKEDARLYFGELDTNEDGLINGSELYEAIKMFHNAQYMNLTTEHVEQLIKLKLDQDGNGLLDIDEFVKADTPATEDEIDKWLVVVGNIDEKVVERGKPRVSEQAWLDQWTTEDEVLLRLQDRVISLTLLPSSIIQTSEHLQVVSYEPGGHYHAHYDSDELDDELECSHTFGIEDYDDERKYQYRNDFSQKRLCRLATVLYYLNDVEEGGGTAFPVADNETFTPESLGDLSYDIYDLSKHCHKSNVVVEPEKGKAILWYNHYLNEEIGWLGENRNHSLHGGCDVIKGTKWIANNWITVDDDVERQIKFHHRYYANLDEQFGEDGTFSDPDGFEKLVDDAEVATEDLTEIDERLRDDDDNPYDGRYGSGSEDTQGTTKQSLSYIQEDIENQRSRNIENGDHIRSNNQEKQCDDKAKNLSHHKTRKKIRETDEPPHILSDSQKSGIDIKISDEL